MQIVSLIQALVRFSGLASTGVQARRMQPEAHAHKTRCFLGTFLLYLLIKYLIIEPEIFINKTIPPVADA